MNAVTLAFLTLVIIFSTSLANAADNDHFGKTNVNAINTGNLQLKGVTWCKKYFDTCVWSESWTGPILNKRETVDASQFVIMQTGITNPEIVDFDDVGGGRYRIIFVYDQQREHNQWIPEFKN